MHYSRPLHDMLIRVAQADPNAPDALITYKEVAQYLNLPLEHEGDVAHLSHMLGEISRREHELGHPLLSVVVVQGEWAGNPSHPGDGFFKLSRELGVFRGKTTDDKVTFFIEELRRVQAHWRQAMM